MLRLKISVEHLKTEQGYAKIDGFLLKDANAKAAAKLDTAEKAAVTAMVHLKNYKRQVGEAKRELTRLQAGRNSQVAKSVAKARAQGGHDIACALDACLAENQRVMRLGQLNAELAAGLALARAETSRKVEATGAEVKRCTEALADEEPARKRPHPTGGALERARQRRRSTGAAKPAKAS